MACHAIAGPLRARRLAQALATRTVEAARLLALLGLAAVVFFQSALAQGQRDPTAIARQPSPQQSVPGNLQGRSTVSQPVPGRPFKPAWSPAFRSFS